MSLSYTVTVTRLIRVSYGDYQLQSIPRGMAIEVPYKPLDRQKRKGPLRLAAGRSSRKGQQPIAPPVKWVKRRQQF